MSGKKAKAIRRDVAVAGATGDASKVMASGATAREVRRAIRLVSLEMARLSFAADDLGRPVPQGD